MIIVRPGHISIRIRLPKLACVPEPKFKVGDRVRSAAYHRIARIVGRHWNAHEMYWGRADGVSHGYRWDYELEYEGVKNQQFFEREMPEDELTPV